MARDYGLPQAVIDIIRQHHGSTLVSYFYCRATENGHAEAVDESAFRYDGPLPESKEAAIVMLADSAEAAVRSLNNPTKGRIEGMVRRLTKERWIRQLDPQILLCGFGSIAALWWCKWIPSRSVRYDQGSEGAYQGRKGQG